jgi:hypothetical protein
MAEAFNEAMARADFLLRSGGIDLEADAAHGIAKIVTYAALEYAAGNYRPLMPRGQELAENLKQF